VEGGHGAEPVDHLAGAVVRQTTAAKYGDTRPRMDEGDATVPVPVGVGFDGSKAFDRGTLELGLKHLGLLAVTPDNEPRRLG
jgi:hypothetical protein